MAELFGDEGRGHSSHQAHGCVRVARIVRRTVTNTQRLQGWTPLMMQVTRLLDVLMPLAGREAVREFLDPSRSLGSPFGIRLGELQGMHSPVIEQHVSILLGLGPVFHFLEGNRPTNQHTKMITGTRMVDTATIQGARVLYCGSELIPTLKGMKDLHGNPAFISIEK